MSVTTIAMLPTNGDMSQWSDQEKALVEAAGLVSRGQLAPRPVVEAFLAHCRRSGLDPISRQIYCIERGGKWQTQVSIDGMRLVAERSREYRGQTPTQWTADGSTWQDVWLSKEPPAAARVGVHREGFAEPLYAVATWAEYAIPNGNMWKKMPALMLGKVCEALALRKAFPQDLSGLYSGDEMAQAEKPAPARQEAVEAVVEPAGPSPDELAAVVVDIAAEQDIQALRALFRRASTEGWLTATVDGDGTTIEHLLLTRGKELQEPAPVVESEAPADLVEQAGESVE